MDRITVTSMSMALLFLCVALLIHSGGSSSVGDVDEMRERVKRAAAAETAPETPEDSPKVISDNPYDRPSNFHLDMYRLLAIALFIGFAIVMYFVVWRFCSGPPA